MLKLKIIEKFHINFIKQSSLIMKIPYVNLSLKIYYQ